jgi:hypothetical protein
MAVYRGRDEGFIGSYRLFEFITVFVRKHLP